MIRDGRDVALSLFREGWIQPLLWDHGQELLVAALHWLWKVNRGRKCGQRVTPDYLEIRFEDFLTNREETLSKISEFVDYNLDPNVIEKNAVGTLQESNSTFRSTLQKSQPIGRWRTFFSQPDIDLIQSVLAPTLRELGYEVTGRELKGDSD